jgi:hypothetical protein
VTELSDVDLQAIITTTAETRVSGNVRPISVVRTQTWRTGRQAFLRKNFSMGAGMLRVTFLGGEEASDASSLTDSEAIDTGGPRREFFRLLLQDAIRSVLLERKFEFIANVY